MLRDFGKYPLLECFIRLNKKVYGPVEVMHTDLGKTVDIRLLGHPVLKGELRRGPRIKLR